MSVFVGDGTTGVEARADRLGLPTGTSDPASATAGETYYNTDTSKIRVYDGTDWADLASGGGTYSIDNSVRFDSASSSYLSRTPSSAGNRTTWTWAGWVKLAKPSNFGVVFDAGSAMTDTANILVRDTGVLQFYAESSNTPQALLQTSQVLRDYSAWYHLVLSVDTTQATASNRIKFYLNGSQITSFSTASYPSQNADLQINAALLHTIGRGAQYQTNNYFDGYLADIHFIDGSALAPTAFGEFDATTGVWNPIEYSGTYGTNGFRLPFSDNSAATATTLGKDSAGSNNWTPNNLSVTAGAGNDSLKDSPTNGTASSGGDAGGVVVGNYATLNPLSLYGTLSNGNLDLVTTVVNAQPSTFFLASGKWYWETRIANNGGGDAFIRAGVCNPSGVGESLGATANGWCFLGDGRVYNNNSAPSYGVAITTGDILNIALDIDAGKIWYGKNGTWMASGNPATGNNPSQTFTAGTILSPAYAAGGGTVIFNFNSGQRLFTTPAPAGYLSLNTANLPTPPILKGSDYFDTNLYTGNGSTQTISGLDFSPDLVWIKSRSNSAYHHRLNDTVRGTTKEIYSNLTNAEGTDPVGLTAFNSDGFTLGSSNEYNASSTTFVSWCWDAGTSTVTNTQGSITSAVRANASAGFSVVTFTGSTSVFTVGHGLGVAPAMVIQKGRNTLSAPWVYHSSIGNTGAVRLDGTGNTVTAASLWNNTSPTSTVVTLGAGAASADPFLIYAFAPVAGYSAFGSYTGNGSADGPFVYTGFRPRWILIKNTSAAGSWILKDTARDPANTMAYHLTPNSSDSDYYSLSLLALDSLSNGFKVRNNNSGHNTNGNVYVYCAFAENPFSIARAR